MLYVDHYEQVNVCRCRKNLCPENLGFTCICWALAMSLSNLPGGRIKPGGSTFAIFSKSCFLVNLGLSFEGFPSEARLLLAVPKSIKNKPAKKGSYDEVNSSLRIDK